MAREPLLSLVLTLSLLAPSLAVPAAAEEPGYTNLQVLPKEISRDELGGLMLANLSGLGLPRLAGEGCLYCHAGDLEVPRSDWDYASDAKPMKAKARVMMAMVREINARLATLDERIDPALEVTCATCHAGRADPRPLPDVLWNAYESGGIGTAEARYRELRERYFGSDAYDFRVHVLPRIALRMADGGAIDDAIALAGLNAEINPEDAWAEQAWVALKLEKTIDAEGTEAALAELDRLAPSLGPATLTPPLLDSLAWRLNRSERVKQGHALIEANYERFPNEYRAIESLAFIRADTGRGEEAFALLERWLDANPDHARARRLLVNLRSKAGD